MWPAAYPDGYAVVDVETTGLGRDDRIVSAAVYRLDAKGTVQDHWYSMVNPERDPGPVWIHGLTSEVLADAPLFREIAGELAERLAGRVLVAHNAVFDWSMLAREYARADHAVPVEQRLCTIVLSKELRLPLPNHKLESLAAHYGVVQQRAHHALDDARVLAEAFRPSLHLAAAAGMRLPLHACRPVTEWPTAEQFAALPGRTARRAGASPASGRPARTPTRGGSRRTGRWCRACGWRSPVTPRWTASCWRTGPSQAGLHVATSVSRLTSLLVTNDPGSPAGKVRQGPAVRHAGGRRGPVP